MQYQTRQRHPCQKYDSELIVEYCTASGLLHCSVYMDRHELWIRETYEEEWRESNCKGSMCDRCGDEISSMKMPSCATTREIAPCEWIETTDGYHISINVDEKPLIKKARPNHHILDRPHAEISTLPRHKTVPEYTINVTMMFLRELVMQRMKITDVSVSQTQCPRRYKFYVQTSSSDPSSGKSVYCCSDGKRCIIERYTLFHGENRQECGVSCTSKAVEAHENHTGNENSELC